QTIPASSPITTALSGETKPEAGVMATSPATSPDAKPRAVGLPLSPHSASIQLRAAAAAAICVTVKAEAASPLAARALPPLKPNQPNQSRPAPVNVRTMLLGCIACSG